MLLKLIFSSSTRWFDYMLRRFMQSSHCVLTLCSFLVATQPVLCRCPVSALLSEDTHCPLLSKHNTHTLSPLCLLSYQCTLKDEKGGGRKQESSGSSAHLAVDENGACQWLRWGGFIWWTLQGQVRIGITDFGGLVILSDSSQHEASPKKVHFLWCLSTDKFSIINKISTLLSGDAFSLCSYFTSCGSWWSRGVCWDTENFHCLGWDILVQSCCLSESQQTIFQIWSQLVSSNKCMWSKLQRISTLVVSVGKLNPIISVLCLCEVLHPVQASPCLTYDQILECVTES